MRNTNKHNTNRRTTLGAPFSDTLNAHQPRSWTQDPLYAQHACLRTHRARDAAACSVPARVSVDLFCAAAIRLHRSLLWYHLSLCFAVAVAVASRRSSHIFYILRDDDTHAERIANIVSATQNTYTHNNSTQTRRDATDHRGQKWRWKHDGRTAKHITHAAAQRQR